MEVPSIFQILENDQELLSYQSSLEVGKYISAPSWEKVDMVFQASDRSPEVLANLHRLYHTGRLSGTGYLSIFPVDQAIEHAAGYSFFKNPEFFDPENIVSLAWEAGCSGVASTLGVLSLTARKYADKIPFILKLNHNELLTYPTKYDQVQFASVEQAVEMGAVGVGATIYFGSPESTRQIKEISALFETAHNYGLCTILWCYPRNSAFVMDGQSIDTAVDLSSQAIHLGVSIGADIVKQKIPGNYRAFPALQFAKYENEMYSKLMSDHPIDLVRYQVLNAFAGKIPLISSGGESQGDFWSDLHSAVKTAVINKRAGGSGLIIGRKVFNHSRKEGIAILQAVQDVYKEKSITLA